MRYKPGVGLIVKEKGQAVSLLDALPSAQIFCVSPRPSGQEVIVHELHLRIPNHGPLFFRVLGGRMGVVDTLSTGEEGYDQRYG